LIKGLINFKEIRTFVVKLLIDNFESNNIEIIKLSLQCLIDFVKTYYDYLENYYEVIWKVTEKYLRERRTELSVPAIEIWNVIAMEDKERSSNRVEVYFHQSKDL
jgi:hypothetical protein